MFNRILVALDGTAEAALGLPLAATLAQGRVAQIILVQVSANYHEDSPPFTAARDYLAACAAGLAAHGLHVAVEVRYGDVAEQIVAAARQHEADVILLTTHGRHGVARAWYGSVAEAVVAGSPVPVLVLRTGETLPRRLQTLLVPQDDSPASAAALALARGVALVPGATLVLLRVVPPATDRGEGFDIDPDAEELSRLAAERALDLTVRDLLRHGIPARARVALGPVAETIAATAATLGADLIVMGTRGRVGPRRALFGSVADAVVRTAARPVLLVRQGTGPGHLAAASAADGRDEARPGAIPAGR